MLLRGFKYYLIGSIIACAFLWLISAILSIGYEGGTDDSATGKFFYSVAELITFSRNVFPNLEMGFMNIAISIFISGTIIAVPISILANVFRRLILKN